MKSFIHFFFLSASLVDHTLQRRGTNRSDEKTPRPGLYPRDISQRAEHRFPTAFYPPSRNHTIVCYGRGMLPLPVIVTRDVTVLIL